jgi:hypothetical protein
LATATDLSYADVVQDMLETLKHGVESDFPLVSHTGKEKLALKLLVYHAAIAPNFVPWMTNTWVHCLSDGARKACADNLLCEVGEDHPAMLCRFVQPVADKYDIGDKVALAMTGITPTINLLSALSHRTLDGLLVMAGLENASLVFIPRMEEMATKLGLTDLEYLKKHGVADEDHAVEFSRAVQAEAQARLVTPGQLKQYATLRFVKEFLRQIFHAG